MTNEGKWSEAEVSWFITSTCQLIPKSSISVSNHAHDLETISSPEVSLHSIVCGSAAEFYIRPLYTCVGDYDFLEFDPSELAIVGDYQDSPIVMSDRPDTIKCYQIEPYEKYPGFVRIQVLGNINYNWHLEKYKFNSTADSGYFVGFDMDSLLHSSTNNSLLHSSMNSLLHSERLPNVICGPAMKSRFNEFFVDIDCVRSIFCPQWPREAKNWSNRSRKYGWPTIDTITDVLESGCHVVYAKHRSCRDDESQWRISFSVAEVILLHSWTQTQQIVYHLLRFFSKRELIDKECPKEDEVLCPYHLKTLMLWSCEGYPVEWWNSLSVISICLQLLHKLKEWLGRRYMYVPNYFIPEANLFHELSNSTMLEKIHRRLNGLSSSRILCQWFKDNYILPIFQTRSAIGLKNRERDQLPDVMDYFMYIIEFRKSRETILLDALLSRSFIASNQSYRSTVNRGVSSGLEQNLKFRHYFGKTLESYLHGKVVYLPTAEVLCFKYYDLLPLILQVVYGLSYEDTSWDNTLFLELVKVISMQPTEFRPKTIRSRYHNFPSVKTEQNDRFQFLRAHHILRNSTGSNCCPEFQLVTLMSKKLLSTALECYYGSSNSSRFSPVALSYLAALHFSTADYKEGIECCQAIILLDQTFQRKIETVNAECLLFIDDVSRIVGLCVLHRKITGTVLHCTYRGRLYLDLRLSPKVFAHYLTVISCERINRHLDSYHDLPDSAFPMDEYLKTLSKRKYIVSTMSRENLKAVRELVYYRTDSMTETVTTCTNPSKETLIDVLLRCALETVTSFFNAIRKDFGIQCNTAECYRASYLYKTHQYTEVLHLCERLLTESDMESELTKLVFTNVSVLPPFDSFFDRDIQSLLGFHTLLYYLSPLNDYLRKVESIDKSVFSHCFYNTVILHKERLWDFTSNPQYSVRCQYSVGRHFLARYLKLRCCMDCNIHYTEALNEFAAQKVGRPFEQIIRKFVLQRMRFIKH